MAAPVEDPPLPARYQIRQIKMEEAKWVQAILAHSTAFYNPLWSVAYPADTHTKRAYTVLEGTRFFTELGIKQGMSYGIFDTEYEFKRPEAKASGGGVYWDVNDLTATRDQLLDAMDNPLVSVANAYDESTKVDKDSIPLLLEAQPGLIPLLTEIERLDPRDPETRIPKEPGIGVGRGGTGTRSDYSGLGLAKALAFWHIREMARRGFKQYTIITSHGAVTKLFSHPPPPFRAEVLACWDNVKWEEEVDGKKVRPYAMCGPVGAGRVLIHLNE